MLCCVYDNPVPSFSRDANEGATSKANRPDRSMKPIRERCDSVAISAVPLSYFERDDVLYSLENTGKPGVFRLYLEHAVRRNVAGVNEESKRWFQTSGIYTSCHDLISKILQ